MWGDTIHYNGQNSSEECLAGHYSFVDTVRDGGIFHYSWGDSIHSDTVRRSILLDRKAESNVWLAAIGTSPLASPPKKT